ncbi:MAG: cupin [Candidatus Omnitrophica bacterium]|nr:cupin [Candidatus Omnitrophota bacterium]
MAKLIEQPTQVEAAGNKPKIIKEFIGRVNSGTGGISIAQMESPQGWVEPGQTPEFDEYTLVLEGALHVKTRETAWDVRAGQAVFIGKGEWVQYSTPDKGAKYVAVCLPAFSPDTVHRDE